MLNSIRHQLNGIRQKRWIILGVILLAAFVVASSCQAANMGTTRGSTIITPSTTSVETTGKSNYLSAYALAQKLAEAINSADQTAAVFQSIPDRQRPEILLDDFVQYIALLRRGITGTITELEKISPEEMTVMAKDLRFSANLHHLGFNFYFKPAGKQTQTMAIFLQQAEDGLPYLDKAPVTKALAIHNFAALYFDAIDRSDQDALSVLVRSRSDIRAPRLLKAERILNFYRSEIVTTSPSFQVVRLMPDRIVYAQQIYIDKKKDQIGTRTMTVFADGAAGFLIDDPIPDQLDAKDLKVLVDGETLFDLSKLSGTRLPQITSSQVTPLLGQQTLHNDFTCTVVEGSTRAMTAYYNGFVITGTGRCDEHRFWRVDLQTAVLGDPRLSLGTGLAVGDSLDTLLMKYPFLDETSFQISRMVGTHQITMQFAVENQRISRITMKVSNG